ncbi:class II glutamine amidotransferase [Rhodococcus sp. NPDC003382]|uniref:class II glutamine amidotransferase n=1 Tax=unclassified Rhodococcus (in: high G+C Gram-positive bacteria) TaxID=192944 RepID=UPI0018CF362B|nr:MULTISPECIES: class II glutamine amidotransferase [unclassified Rhodococcus (in: high G+C Gram-positive bacteria)]MBH0118273.1 class II glutamine amidotransferase [Rhodococcus sp. CX]MCK8673713.1 class II glutamine amidotransferase [Rhodococcus sp. HM1]
MAYSGEPILAEDLLFRPVHSLIDQSLHSQLGATTTNGDGFGIGWYGEGPRPALFKSIEPAWNDRNLRELASQIRSGMFFAHVRASTGSPVQRSNCHPFRYGNWLWMHNGEIVDYRKIKRELLLAVEAELYTEIMGSTDSEALFYLALTFGLTDDPLGAVGRAVGFVEKTARAHGIENPVQMTVATSDGTSMWFFRYSSQVQSRSLYYSTDMTTLRALHPEVEVLAKLGPRARLVVSEPLRDLPGAWNEVPEASAGTVGPYGDEILPFVPLAP